MHCHIHTLTNQSRSLADFLAEEQGITEFSYMHTEYVVSHNWIDNSVYHVQVKGLKKVSKRRMKKAFDRLVYVINAVKGFN